MWCVLVAVGECTKPRGTSTRHVRHSVAEAGPYVHTHTHTLSLSECVWGGGSLRVCVWGGGGGALSECVCGGGGGGLTGNSAKLRCRTSDLDLFGTGKVNRGLRPGGRRSGRGPGVSPTPADASPRGR